MPHPDASSEIFENIIGGFRRHDTMKVPAAHRSNLIEEQSVNVDITLLVHMLATPISRTELSNARPNSNDGVEADVIATDSRCLDYGQELR